MSLAINRMGEYSGEVNVDYNFTAEDEALLQVLLKDIKDDQFEDSAAVPYPDLIHLWNFLPYGNTIRVMTKVNFEIGCRCSELDRLDMNNPEVSFVKGGRVYWRVGKNQKGQWRSEPLSIETLKELIYYRRTHRMMGSKFFAIKSTTMRRMFNKFVRPHLGKRWNEKKDTPDKLGQYEYKFQMKGLRKSWATLKFAQLIDYWKGNVTAALAFIQKRMKHTGLNMTVNHYLESFEALEIDKWRMYSPGEIVAMANQTHLVEYVVDKEQFKLIYDDPQPPLRDWMN